MQACHLPSQTGSSSGQKQNPVLLLHLPHSAPWAQSSASPSGAASSRVSLPTECGSARIASAPRRDHRAPSSALTGSALGAWYLSTARDAMTRTGHTESVMNNMGEGRKPAWPAESPEANRYISGGCCFDGTDRMI